MVEMDCVFSQKCIIFITILISKHLLAIEQATSAGHSF